MADLGQLVDALSSLTVLEAAELTKMLEEKWGVSAAAAAPMMMPGMMGGGAGGGEAAAEVEEQTEFDVILVDKGAKKINVIKEVRKMTSLGLKEAKEVVDNAPSTIMEAVSKEAAEEAKAALEAVGAKAEIK